MPQHGPQGNPHNLSTQQPGAPDVLNRGNPGNPAGPVVRARPNFGGAGGDIERQVIEGYMSLSPDEKRIFLRAMDGVLGSILAKILPDQLDDLIQEAIQTPPEEIGNGTTPPRAAAKFGLTGQAPGPPPLQAPGPPPGPPAGAPPNGGTLGSSAIPPRLSVLRGFG